MNQFMNKVPNYFEKATKPFDRTKIGLQNIYLYRHVPRLLGLSTAADQLVAFLELAYLLPR